MSVNQHWHDPVAESYAPTIAHKVPGYHLLHELTVDRVEIDLMGGGFSHVNSRSRWGRRDYQHASKK